MKSLIVPKIELSVRTTTFSQDEISYASRRVPFDQIIWTHIAEKNPKERPFGFK